MISRRKWGVRAWASQGFLSGGESLIWEALPRSNRIIGLSKISLEEIAPKTKGKQQK